MREIDPSNDDLTYTGGGTVVDIDVFSNISFLLNLERRLIFSIKNWLM